MERTERNRRKWGKRVNWRFHVLGKTVPSSRVALEHEIQRWSRFARALRQDDREVFEQLMDICKNYASAASYTTRPVLFEAMAMTILLDQQKTINQLEKKLQATHIITKLPE
jgi:hypothetical protein